MKKNLLKFVTLADPIESFDCMAETTFFIMQEICRRGFENWVMTLDDLFLEDSHLWGWAQRVHVTQRSHVFSYQVCGKKKLLLDRMDCILLRKDPPVDEKFLNHLSLLEVLERSSGRHPLFINSPRGIKGAGEKIYPFHFSEISPATLVSSDRKTLHSFIKKHQKVVIKPLNKAGGQGIFVIQADDPNKNSLLETCTSNYKDYVLLQKFIPEAACGDKRILLLDGDPLGAFCRIPSQDDFRGNMHRGARWVKTTVNQHEKALIQKIKPKLQADGLYFVGLDLIGSFVTEINTTSPMGVREINQLYRVMIEKKILDWIEGMLQQT